jgi:hypothetical protein
VGILLYPGSVYLYSIDIVLNRPINGTYCLPCFALLVLLVANPKIHFKENALVSSTKQNTQADKAVRPACFVLGLLQAPALTSGFWAN